MEPVEDQRQLLRRDGVSVIADGDIGLAAALPDLQSQIASLGTELDGVIQQIVDHLGNIVRVRHGVHRMLRHIHLDIQVLVVDLLFEGDQHLSGALLQVEMHLLFLGDALFLLQLGDIQHTAHQAAEPLGLIGNDPKVMLLALLGDGAVQNAVYIAGDGGHGSLQLMGDVGHELLPLVLAFLQGGGHIVEGQSQLLHLLGIVVLQLDPGLQIAVTEGCGCLCHILQGAAFPPGKGGDRQHGYHDHKDGGGEENVGDPV